MEKIVVLFNLETGTYFQYLRGDVVVTDDNYKVAKHYDSEDEAVDALNEMHEDLHSQDLNDWCTRTFYRTNN